MRKANKILASAIWVNNDLMLLQHDEGEYHLPGIEVQDDETNEMALTEFFRKKGWAIAVGGLRYLVEEIKNDSKILHLTFEISVMKQGSLDEDLTLKLLSEIDDLNVQPVVLFGKLLADLQSSKSSGCVTLVSW